MQRKLNWHASKSVNFTMWNYVIRKSWKYQNRFSSCLKLGQNILCSNEYYANVSAGCITKWNSFKLSRSNKNIRRLGTVNAFLDTESGIINCLKWLAFPGEIFHIRNCLTLMLGFWLITLIKVFDCILFVWKLIKANDSRY